MAKIDLLRQLIREEVVKALRQELPKIISENINSSRGVNNIIKEMKKSEVPITLNTIETYQKKPTQYAKSSPLNDILNETAMSMGDNDVSNINLTTDNINPVSFFQPKEANIGDINSMISTANKSMNLETTQINEVPDYSNLMKKMLNKGLI